MKMTKELMLPTLTLAVIVIAAFYVKTSLPAFYVFEPLDIELKSPDVLNFDLRNISINEISGYDHVEEVTLREVEDYTILGITYYFENESCSEGIRVIAKFDVPQDWSRYDGMIVNIFGDNSNNTLQFWYWDMVSGKMVCIGTTKLDWFGWRRFEFYMIPLAERDSVTQFRIVVLHNKDTIEGREYTLYIASPVFIENLKGKLNIVQRGWNPYDEVQTRVYRNKEMFINYNFKSKESKSVKVMRHFLIPQDLSAYDVLDVSVYGDGSNNTLRFWYKDRLAQRNVCIGSVKVDWKGWRKLSFELPEHERRHVERFSITIVYGQTLEPHEEVPAGGRIKSNGTIRILDPVFRKDWHLDWPAKLAVVLFYLVVFSVLRKRNEISPSNPFILVMILLAVAATVYLVTGKKLLANDLAEMGYIFIVVGTVSLLVYLRTHL